MADQPDTSDHEQITKLIESGEHGQWHEENGRKVFTPNMTMLVQVPPHRLLDYFLTHGGSDLRLNLP
jgi:hypothetical protein